MSAKSSGQSAQHGKSPAPKPTAQQTNLTLHTDTLTTSKTNIVFNAPLIAQVATLQTGDTIIDTGTGGTLNAFFNPVALNLLGAQITGVATWNLTNVGTFSYGYGNTQLISGGSLVSGLQTLNDLNSNAPIVVGVSGAPLQAALTTISVTNTNSSLTALVASSALSGNANVLTLNLTNANGAITVGPDNSATDGYDVWNIVANGTNNIALSQGGATSAATVVISGSGNFTLLSDFGNLATIDGSTSTGNLNITGGNSGLLKIIKGGSGNDTFDLSAPAYTAAAINAMTVVDGGGGANTLILNNAALTSGSLSKPTHFQTFGDTAPNGIIDMSLLPSSVNGIKFFGLPTGGLTVNNAPSVFTLDQGHYDESALTISAANTSVLTNSVTIDFGSTAFSDLGPSVITTGYGIVNITCVSSVSGNGLFQSLASGTFTANPSGSVEVDISGNSPLIVQSFDGTGLLILNGTSTTINDSNTAQVDIPGTNAAVINAASSGGLVMGAPDTNFSGTTGDHITGSTTHANTLFGSLGNDVITASTIGGDTIRPVGGADTINLNSHATSDTVQFGWSGDLTKAGFWGVPPSGEGSGVTPTVSTSADQSVVTHFLAGSSGDVLKFTGGAWFADPNNPGFPTKGLLTFGDGNTPIGPVSFPHGGNSGPPATVIDAVAPEATMASNADVIELTGATFASASELATALGTTYSLTFAGTGAAANTDPHMLFLYNDASGNAHLADVDFENGANASAAPSTAAVSHIVASDMVELVGVSMTSLTVNNIQFA